MYFKKIVFWFNAKICNLLRFAARLEILCDPDEILFMKTVFRALGVAGILSYCHTYSSFVISVASRIDEDARKRILRA